MIFLEYTALDEISNFGRFIILHNVRLKCHKHNEKYPLTLKVELRTVLHSTAAPCGPLGNPRRRSCGPFRFGAFVSVRSVHMYVALLFLHVFQCSYGEWSHVEYITPLILHNTSTNFYWNNKSQGLSALIALVLSALGKTMMCGLRNEIEGHWRSKKK